MSKRIGIPLALGALLSAVPVFAQELMISDVLEDARAAGLCGARIPTNAVRLDNNRIAVTCSPVGTPVASGPVSAASGASFVPPYGNAGIQGVATGLLLLAVMAGGGGGSTGTTTSTN